MLNLQRLYLILGNFCNAFAMQQLSTGTHTLKRFSFFFFLIFVLLFFFFQNLRLCWKLLFICAFCFVMSPCNCLKLMVCLHIAYAYWFCLKVWEKRVINRNIFDNTACGFRICWWGTEGNWLYSKLRKHFNSILKTVQKRKKGIARKIVLNFWETT